MGFPAPKIAEKKLPPFQRPDGDRPHSYQRKSNGPYSELLTLGLAYNTPRRRPWNSWQIAASLPHASLTRLSSTN